MTELVTGWLADLPVNAAIRERHQWTIDILAQSERKVADSETQNQILRAEKHTLEQQLKECHIEKEEAKAELRALQETHAEEVRILRTIEFRRGRRTGQKWLPFCPKCHMPSSTQPERTFVLCTAQCGWVADMTPGELPGVIAQLT